MVDQQNHISDVIIVGGGLVGSITAIALATAGINTVLIDHADLTSLLNAQYDGRTIAISYGSRLIFEHWKLWNELQDYVQPIQEIRVTNGTTHSFIHYDGQQTAHHPMGYIIEIRHLRRILMMRLQSLSTCVLKAPAKLQAIQQQTSTVSVELDDIVIDAKLVIGADGRHSMVRKLMGIKPMQWSYQQTAIVCVVKHTQEHNDVAFEIFQPTGPLALLPMQNGRSSVIWTLAQTAAEAFLHLSNDEFNYELQQRFGKSLGILTVEGERWSYNLEGAYCRNWYKGRVALVGDACHAIHPVAGQGFNLGLRDAEVLVNKIIQAQRQGQDIGQSSLLSAYQRQRRFDSLSMTVMTDGLVRLFSNYSPSLRLLRSMGMNIINKITPVKKMLTRHAMGLPLIR